MVRADGRTFPATSRASAMPSVDWTEHRAGPRASTFGTIATTAPIRSTEHFSGTRRSSGNGTTTRSSTTSARRGHTGIRATVARAGYPNLVAQGLDTFFAYTPMERTGSDPSRSIDHSDGDRTSKYSFSMPAPIGIATTSPIPKRTTRRCSGETDCLAGRRHPSINRDLEDCFERRPDVDSRPAASPSGGMRGRTSAPSRAASNGSCCGCSRSWTASTFSNVVSVTTDVALRTDDCLRRRRGRRLAIGWCSTSWCAAR